MLVKTVDKLQVVTCSRGSCKNEFFYEGGPDEAKTAKILIRHGWDVTIPDMMVTCPACQKVPAI